jgi:plastocyanin
MTGRILLAGLATLAALACGGSTPTGNNPAGDIQVGNNFFAPTTFTVAAGTAVTWFWSPGGVAHTVTFEDGAPGANQSSGTFGRTFSTAGTYPYFCSIHGAAVMSGSVTVTAAGTGTGTGGGGGGGGTTNGGGYGM